MKFQIPKNKLQLKCEIVCLFVRICFLEFVFWNLELGTWYLDFGISCSLTFTQQIICH